MAIVDITTKLYLIGPCYCQQEIDKTIRNKVMCMNNENHTKWDLCDEDQWCVGPTTPKDSQAFSKSIFCQNGKLKST